MLKSFSPDNKSKQTLILAVGLLDTMYQAARPLVGRENFKEIVFPVAKNSVFEKIKIKDRVELGETGVVSYARLASSAGEIFNELYNRLGGMVGRDKVKRVVENYFRPHLGEENGEAVYDLLGAMPAEILQRERGERSVYLESAVSKKTEDITIAHRQLIAQTEMLAKTVDELKQMNNKLQLADKTRGDFMRVVSHQFRTPLSIIRWNTELLADSLKKRKMTEEETEALQTIDFKGKFLIDALNKVFNVLAIDTESATIDRRPGFLWEVVEEAAEGFKEQMKKRKIVFKFDKSKDPLEEIDFDKEKIKEAANIFLANAVNYAKEGGKIKIKIQAVRKEGKGYLETSISDDGIGISAENIKKVFDKFFRGENAIKVAPDGTGLGMYIAKNFIEMHGGKVEVISKEGEGCEIVFLLPLPAKKEKA